MLTISQVAEIAEELSGADTKIIDAIESMEKTEEDKQAVLDKNSLIKTFYNTSNNNINAYFDEVRWISGLTQTKLPYNDIDNGARRALGNIFYPAGWQNFAPFMDDKVSGLPVAGAPNSESDVFTKPLEAGGLDALLDFIVSGQASGVSSDTLDNSYTPGALQIDVTTGGQTPGKLLIISGSGTSALVMVTNVAGATLDIVEVIAPASTIVTAGSSVIENIIGFTNNERNTLVSASYQRVLTELTIDVIASMSSWDVALTSQLLALQSNSDSNKTSETANAISDGLTATGVVATWTSLPNTGSTGNDSKFTDNNLSSLTLEISTRKLFHSVRVSQVSGALGVVSQNGAGLISGNGLYRDRFERISLQINTADGPLFQFYALDAAKGASQQQISSTKQKNRTYASGIVTSKFSENPEGDLDISVENGSDFDVSDRAVVTASGLESIVVDIDAKVGNLLTLSKRIPKDYILDLKVSISKSK